MGHHIARLPGLSFGTTTFSHGGRRGPQYCAPAGARARTFPRGEMKNSITALLLFALAIAGFGGMAT
ncbi:MAG: hypothetical protein ACRD3O_14165, partial [Terriglobia bacterium]